MSTQFQTDYGAYHCVKSKIWRRLNACIAPNPPELKTGYTADEYRAFMQRELLLVTPAYARGRIVVRGQENLFSSLEHGSVILGFIHFGSWILIGGAMRYIFKVPYTVIASRRNFPLLDHSEAEYWKHIHRRMIDYYGYDIFYTDQSPRRIIEWLKQSGVALGVALDVREHEHFPPERQIHFNGTTLWVQSGPAKLARLSRSVIVPCSIEYVPEFRVHELKFYPSVDPQQTESDYHTTQKVFSALQEVYTRSPQQEFHDLMQIFSQPHQAVQVP
jgi:lauroyl/myristoyl acyltransferase